MKKPRLARKTEFWLNAHDETENRLIATIADLKAARLFSRAIREGLQVMAGLLRGDIAPLVELYPWVISEILVQYAPPPPQPEPPKNNGDTSGGESISQQLKRLEQLVIMQGSNQNPVAAPMSGNLKPMGTGNMIAAGGIGDLSSLDFNLEIKQTETSQADKDRVAANLVNSIIGFDKIVEAYEAKH